MQYILSTIFCTMFQPTCRWLWAKEYAFLLCTGIMQFLVWALDDRPGKAIRRLCRDCTEIVQCLCICCAVTAIPYGNCTALTWVSVHRPRCSDCARAVRLSQEPLITIWFLVPQWPIKSCVSANSAHRPPTDAPRTWAYNFFNVISPH